MRTKSMIVAAMALTALTTGVARAHPGHGDDAAPHWHAFDAWGWALALALAAVGLWLSRRK